MDSAADSASAPWHSLSPGDVAARLKVDPARGLSAAEAAGRLARTGPNEFAREKPKSLGRKFIGQFRSVMILILLAAALISGVVGVRQGEGVADSLIILLIVVVNAVIGVAQEAKAEKALEALERMAAPHCTAIRDGRAVEIEARELVPGDVVTIETGDLVPADLRLAEAVNLKVGEAALTGESAAVDKDTAARPAAAALGDRADMAFATSTVTYGRGRGVVVATGMATEVGKIAGMLQAVPDTRTPLQRRIDQLGKFLGMAAVAVCAVIFTVGFLEGRDVLEMFMIAVSLAAAAIPEGLPAVSTIVLAVGVQRLARQNAIVRNLPSVETLGGASVICSDKTGTLTQNRMTVTELCTSAAPAAEAVPDLLDADQNRLLLATLLPNDATLSRQGEEWTTTGDPTETAFLDLALRHGLDKNDAERERPRLAEVPFDSERKMMSTVNREGDGFMVWTKGGVDEVLARSTRILDHGEERPLTDADREAIRAANAAMAERALRVLAGAYRAIEAVPEPVTSAGVEAELVFAGMAGMIDPPRPEAAAAVAECRTAGIKPVMITGDHPRTAVAIAGALGIKRAADKFLTGAEVEKMADADLEAVVADTAVYARVAPEHKVRIVRALQARGETVAMTGDGVNDAPALKLADIGVAMGITGTDVSKGAADVVLADDNFATIVLAVGEGRRIYDNILKAIQFMLSTNLGEILVIFTAIMLKWPTPLLPIQILWINLVTDSLPALALAVDPAEAGVMERPPVPAERGIMRGGYLARIILQGVMIAGLSLAGFLLGLRHGVDEGRTMAFAVLALAQVTQVMNVRSAWRTAFAGMFSNRWLWGAIAVVVGLMLLVLEIPRLHDFFHLAPLTRDMWLWIVALSLAPLPIVEATKGLYRLVRRPGRAA